MLSIIGNTKVLPIYKMKEVTDSNNLYKADCHDMLKLRYKVLKI